MRFKDPTPTFVDNQSCLVWLRDPAKLTTRKHVDIHRKHVESLQEEGELEFKWVATSEQLADPLTKSSINISDFCKWRNKMMIDVVADGLLKIKPVA